jgi:hypothetical protein
MRRLAGRICDDQYRCTCANEVDLWNLVRYVLMFSPIQVEVYIPRNRDISNSGTCVSTIIISHVTACSPHQHLIIKRPARRYISCFISLIHNASIMSDAAHRLWAIPHARKKLIHLLPRIQQIECLPLSRISLPEFVAPIYRSITYEEWDTTSKDADRYVGRNACQQHRLLG